VRLRIGPCLAALLLVLCVGLQVLEATGRWDHTFQDSRDEAIVVTIVLCVGAALVVAVSKRCRVRLVAIGSPLAQLATTSLSSFLLPRASALGVSPPLRLRI